MKYIKVKSPEYYGASYPSFNEKAVNESAFPKEYRYKECEIAFDEASNACDISWLMQESDELCDKLIDEFKRALKANGAKPGCNIRIFYGIRDDGLNRFKSCVLH